MSNEHRLDAVRSSWAWDQQRNWVDGCCVYRVDSSVPIEELDDQRDVEIIQSTFTTYENTGAADVVLAGHEIRFVEQIVSVVASDIAVHLSGRDIGDRMKERAQGQSIHPADKALVVHAISQRLGACGACHQTLHEACLRRVKKL